jgi:hypothetical protein
MIPYQCCSFIPFHARVRHATGIPRMCLIFHLSRCYEEKWVEQEHIVRISSLSFHFFLLLSFDKFSGCYVNYDKAKRRRREKGNNRKNTKNKRRSSLRCWVMRWRFGRRKVASSPFNFLLSNINHKNMEDYLP